MEILNKIPFNLNIGELMSSLHIEEDSEDAREITDIVEKIEPVIKPKALYEISYIESRDNDKVNIGGTIFTSRVLRVNLDKVERVFPYIATCGRELEEIENQFKDILYRFWIDTIKGMALDSARTFLNDYLKEKYALKKLSSINPGSGSKDLWPIEQQKLLFSIFGDVESLIGVRLTDSFLMIPNKTVSGIYFCAEASFESCQICPREVCSGRKACYDESISKKYYENK